MQIILLHPRINTRTITLTQWHFIAGMFSFPAASLIMSMPKNGRKKPNNLDAPPSLEHADTTNKLLPIGDNDFVPSVIENTTDLLPSSRAERKNGRT